MGDEDVVPREYAEIRGAPGMARELVKDRLPQRVPPVPKRALVEDADGWPEPIAGAVRQLLDVALLHENADQVVAGRQADPEVVRLTVSCSPLRLTRSMMRNTRLVLV